MFSISDYVDFLDFFKRTAKSIVDFLSTNILGSPVIYWLLGGGLIVYLTWRIIQAVTPL